MKVCILMGSPNRDGNTETLLAPVKEQFKNLNIETEEIYLYDKGICPCLGCYTCQEDPDNYYCVYDDDMEDIIESIQNADCILFATPIYTWYCTPPVKTFLDRTISMVRVQNKSICRNLWNYKKIALLVTYGGDDSESYDLFETTLKRYASFLSTEFIGTYAVRDSSGKSDFTDRKAVNGAREFANKIYNSICMESKVIKLNPFED